MIFTNLLYSSNGPSIPVEDKIFSTECISLEGALMWILCGNSFAKRTHSSKDVGAERASIKVDQRRLQVA